MVSLTTRLHLVVESKGLRHRDLREQIAARAEASEALAWDRLRLICLLFVGQLIVACGFAQVATLLQLFV